MTKHFNVRRVCITLFSGPEPTGEENLRRAGRRMNRRSESERGEGFGEGGTPSTVHGEAGAWTDGWFLERGVIQRKGKRRVGRDDER